MELNPESISIREMYGHMVRMITPRPIAWVSSTNPQGIHNLAPYSFFNGVSANPPALCFSPVNTREGQKKDTVINIEHNRQFVVNIVPARLAEVMNQTSFEYDHDESEFTATGLTPIPSIKIAPPRLAESPIQMECELIQIVSLGEGPLAPHLVIGKILLVHVDDQILDESGQICASKLDTIGRMGGSDYCRTRDRFELPRPTKR